MVRRVKLLVHGRVQGVYFRYFTQKKAKELGVVGTVRNLSNGNVEIVAQAEEAVLQAMIDWSHRGPITARVDRVEIGDMKLDESLVRFDIV